jgi:hypothetical protein
VFCVNRKYGASHSWPYRALRRCLSLYAEPAAATCSRMVARDKGRRRCTKSFLVMDSHSVSILSPCSASVTAPWHAPRTLASDAACLRFSFNSCVGGACESLRNRKAVHGGRRGCEMVATRHNFVYCQRIRQGKKIQREGFYNVAFSICSLSKFSSF